MPEYPLIADHCLIGDLQKGALVGTKGAIDWFGAPRLDSPSMFASLLDPRRSGHLTVRPTAEAVASKQLHFPTPPSSSPGF
jgi:GH15 family glucan-1,4-alpha-glucosidase